ncbi:MAG: hypothetical protein ACK4OM_07535 [Alphaproteobacteria bacterium]
MKGIKTLIKLKKRELDSKRKTLSELEIKLENLHKVIEMLDEELKKEQEIAATVFEASLTYNNYYIDNRQKKEIVNNEVTKVVRQIKILQEEIFIDFTELKKYDISLENQINYAKEKQKSKDQQNLDELAINNYLQKNDENQD